MADRFDPPRDLDWKPLPMRPDMAGEYVRYSDLAAVRSEIERLTKERDNLSKLEQSHREQANEQFHRAIKAEAERDDARSMLSDAERDMRQRAADLCENYRHGKQGMAAARAIKWAIVNLPLKHADREGDGHD